jgi:hypothetical protein
MLLRTVTVLALLALPTAALADRTEADVCAQNLTGEALKTYRAGVGMVEATSTLEQAVRAHLEPLYNAGKITEAEGRKIGEEAAKCMRLVHRK